MRHGWAAGLAGLAAADAPPAATIHVHNYLFGPASVIVAAGTRVMWINDDVIVHKIVADAAPPAFQSPGMDEDDTFVFTFAQPGVYHYHCTLHPKMQGVVVVRAGP